MLIVNFEYSPKSLEERGQMKWNDLSWLHMMNFLLKKVPIAQFLSMFKASVYFSSKLYILNPKLFIFFAHVLIVILN